MKYVVSLIFFALALSLVVIFVKNSYNSKKGDREKSSSIGAVANSVVSRNKIFVSPEGSDKNNGKTEALALKTIQKAIDRAIPGDTVELLPGEYYQDVVTKKDGLQNKPITIRGQKSSILKGAGGSRVFQINHSYITLNGFTIDGHFKESVEKTSYRDKLIYVTGKIPLQVITHVRIVNMDIKNAGGECVRLRYFIQNSEIAYNSIFTCGVVDFEFNGGGKNGEGIYIGTAPEQLKDGKNPTSSIDHSNYNWIHHNIIDTQGNECVDIKEGSSFNVVEYNKCTGQKDEKSGGLDARGDANVFRYNQIYDNLGAGVRLGGDAKIDGINNQVYGNKIISNMSGGIKFQRAPQGKTCGNEMQGNEKGNSNGPYGKYFNPEKKC